MKDLGINIEGNAFISFNKGTHYLQFSPTEPGEQLVEPFVRRGTCQVMRDGTSTFVSEKSHRSEALCIKKVAHGRISLTKHLHYHFEFDVDPGVEAINVAQALEEEATEAADGLRRWQLQQ